MDRKMPGASKGAGNAGSGIQRFARVHRFLCWTLLFCILVAGATAYDSRLSSNPEKWRIRNDFTNYTLAASKAVLRGEDPYTPDNLNGHKFRYFPFNAVVYFPLAGLPVPLAQGVWAAVNLMLLIFALRALPDLMGGGKTPLVVWIAALAIAGRFIHTNFKLGQWNLPVFSLSVLGLWLVCCRRQFWRGGALLALASALKFMPFGFFFYFAVKRQWRVCAAMLVGVLFWILILPTLVLGVHRHQELLHTYLSKSGKWGSQQVASGNKLRGHSLAVFLKAYLSPCEQDGDRGENGGAINRVNMDYRSAAHISLIVCGLLLLLTLWTAGRNGPSIAPSPRLGAEIASMFLLFLLISPEVLDPQFLTTFVAAFVLAGVWRGNTLPSSERWTCFAGLIIAFLLILQSTSLGPQRLRDWSVLHGSLTLMIGILYTLSLTVAWRLRTAGKR
jgi:hypothetical protein